MTTENRPSFTSEEPTILAQLLEAAERKFWSQESFPYHDHQEAYTDFTAAAETIEEAITQLGMKPSDILNGLIQQTSLTPEDMIGELEMVLTRPPHSWQDLFSEFSEKIIAEELRRRRPEIVAESSRRTDRYDNPNL